MMQRMHLVCVLLLCMMVDYLFVGNASERKTLPNLLKSIVLHKTRAGLHVS
jgi:hypothetical protein